MGRIPAVISICAVAVLASAMPAQAQFQVCNQTLDVVNVAIGYTDSAANDRSQGWWTIGSNACGNVIRDEIPSRYVFVYATDVFGQALLEGTQTMCVAEEAFEIEGVGDCYVRGFRDAAFFEVDTQATSRWTLFLSEPTN